MDDYGRHDHSVWESIFEEMPAEWYDAPPCDNPTKGCKLVVYDDAELTACLPGWSITRLDASAERFRVIEATFHGS